MSATRDATLGPARPVSSKGPAGPRGHWLLGSLRQLWKDPLGMYEKAWRGYGDYVPIRLLPGVYAYLVVHSDGVEYVLQKHQKNYRKPDVLTRPMNLFIGNNLFTGEGDFWLRQRRLMQPAFGRQHLVQLSTQMVAAAEAFLRERQAAAPEEEVDILDAMMRLYLRVASTTLFGTDITGEAAAIGRAYRVAFEYVSRRMNSFQLLPP
jgi:cytochrome P450